MVRNLDSSLALLLNTTGVLGGSVQRDAPEAVDALAACAAHTAASGVLAGTPRLVLRRALTLLSDVAERDAQARRALTANSVATAWTGEEAVGVRAKASVLCAHLYACAGVCNQGSQLNDDIALGAHALLRQALLGAPEDAAALLQHSRAEVSACVQALQEAQRRAEGLDPWGSEAVAGLAQAQQLLQRDEL